MAEARDIYRQYIAMRKIIGEEQSAWNTQKAALSDMLEVLRTEISQTRELISTLEDSASTADRRRAELRTELEESRRASASFNAEIASYEKRVAACCCAHRMPCSVKSPPWRPVSLKIRRRHD
ncbi:MAG: hypothetical protein LR015_05985 [Verrucomicrobia bacterium]|nr:hypothetical protein [Verrucomicrobiota bacterium]